MTQIEILLIEDDEIAAELIHDFLVDFDFGVTVVDTVTDGLSYIRQYNYGVVLLDLSLPDYSGLELLKHIKNSYSIPIIIISGHSDTKYKLQAFKYGASDYMTKPIDLEELEARIWVVMGRHSNIVERTEKMVFEIDNETIFFKQTELTLTSIEYTILSTLLEYKNQTIAREALISSLSSLSSHRSLDNHIKNIRKKIGDGGSNPKYLKTEYGVGYKLNVL